MTHGTRTASFYAGEAYFPEDIEVLQRAFDRACTERRLSPGDTEASTVAVTLLGLFRNGVSDEDELVSAAAERAARQMRVA